ncbi:hypothetical protein OESDEN_02734, partial [Oesophagostomum dentatum]
KARHDKENGSNGAAKLATPEIVENSTHELRGSTIEENSRFGDLMTNRIQRTPIMEQPRKENKARSEETRSKEKMSDERLKEAHAS